MEPIALYGCGVWGPLTNLDFTKLDKHQIETLHAEFCKNILCVQRKTQNNVNRAPGPACLGGSSPGSSLCR